MERQRNSRPVGSNLPGPTRGTAPGGIVLSTVVAASILLLLGGIIGIGQQRGLYDWPAAYTLYAAATALIGGLAVWRLGTHFRQVEHEREHHFRLGLDLQAIADFNGRFLRVNPAFTDALGWSSEDLVSRPFVEFVHPDDRAATLAQVEQLRRGQPVLQFDNRYRCKDGSWRVLSWRAAPSLDDGRIYASARDVTALRMSEQRLRESEENLAVTLRSIADGVLATDAGGRVTRLNPVAERLTGWTEHEALGRPVTEVLQVVDHATREPRPVPAEAALKSGKVQEPASGALLLARDGTAHPIADSAAPIRDRNGAVAGVVLVFRDVSGERAVEAAMQRINEDLDRRVRKRTAELEQANAELEQIRERLELAARAGNVGLWDWNLQTGDVYYSPEYERQLGYEPHELEHRYEQWVELLHPDDRDRAVGAIEEYAKRPAGRYAQEFRLRHKDGSYRWIHAQGSIVSGRHGGPRMVGTHIDVTERRRLEDQFHQAQKMESVGRLAGGVAHDFNNLLSVINGYSDLAMQSLGEDNPAYEDIAEVRKAGTRAASLTRQLLAFSRKQVLQPVVVDLAAQLSDLENMLGRLIGEDVDLRVDSEKELGRVKIDPGQFEQVVVNLAVNSRDAMPNGGTLSVHLRNASRDEIPAAGAESPDRFVCLTVSDNGAGMDAETLEQVYEPFFTTKRDGRGTGLGLATVYGIVKQSGGFIHATSQPGLGTAFHVFLPAVDAAAQKTPRRSGPARAPRGSETVLLVEDDEHLRRLTERLLRTAGYTVLTAPSAEDAVGLLERGEARPDLLLTDIVMPGESGPMMAQRLRELHPELRWLFMSGYAGEAIAQYADIIEQGHFIAKPFNAAQLTEKVREVLNLSPVTEGVER